MFLSSPKHLHISATLAVPQFGLLVLDLFTIDFPRFDTRAADVRFLVDRVPLRQGSLRLRQFRLFRIEDNSTNALYTYTDPSFRAGILGLLAAAVPRDFVSQHPTDNGKKKNENNNNIPLPTYATSYPRRRWLICIFQEDLPSQRRDVTEMLIRLLEFYKRRR